MSCNTNLLDVKRVSRQTWPTPQTTISESVTAINDLENTFWKLHDITELQDHGTFFHQSEVFKSFGIEEPTDETPQETDASKSDVDSFLFLVVFGKGQFVMQTS